MMSDKSRRIATMEPKPSIRFNNQILVQELKMSKPHSQFLMSFIQTIFIDHRGNLYEN